ncbi:hypothetical protein HMPREF0063_11294 [Aeromicrobium marinum DSM 15272]|uniref:DUF4233 domain-containing protein n=2 Tax=Aeromicrobium marinum TaxID=219314 RepID=E2SB85_9ACTN|nr:hypothetical protein HMPREF0063_11294 [Aeromicrobium marinum DSM 15272]
MLFFQSIVLGLSTPVMISVEGVDRTPALVMGLGLTVLCLLTAGSLRRPQAYWVGHGIQVASIGLGFLVPIMFFVGGMFAALWIAAFRLGARIDEDKARWAREAAEQGDETDTAG